MTATTNTVEHTPGPWSLCHHLKSVAHDQSCSCGYRGVIFGPETNVPMAICQPGHDAEPKGEEFTGPQRYPREVELANARLIASAPDLLDALQSLFASYKDLADSGDAGFWSLEDMPVGKQALAAIAKATGSPAPQENG